MVYTRGGDDRGTGSGRLRYYGEMGCFCFSPLALRLTSGMGTSVHVVLLIHGLWGSPAHLRVAKEELEAAWGAGAGEGEELVVMVAGGMTSQLTYDGIDVCASRVAWEVRPPRVTPPPPLTGHSSTKRCGSWKHMGNTWRGSVSPGIHWEGVCVVTSPPFSR